MNLKLNQQTGAALYEALYNTIYVGNDMKNFTPQQREDMVSLFKKVQKFNPQWNK